MLLLHNSCDSRLLADLQLAEDMGIVGRNTMIVAEGALQPGMPQVLWHVLGKDRIRSPTAELVEVSGDWILIRHPDQSRRAQAVDTSHISGDGFPELCSLS